MSRLQSDASERPWERIAFHGSALLGNYVYIDGGELGLPGPDDQDRVKRANDRTYSIDVSKNWSTSSISIRTIDKPTSLPSLVSPALWSDSSANVLYSFGGDTSWDPPVNKTSFQNRFQKFIPDGSGGGEWSPDLDRTDDDVPDHISPPVGGFISQAKESGFYLGGYEPYAAVMDARYRRPAAAVPQPGIVTFNFENRIWTNDTITPYTLGGGSVGYGAMHYVPIFGPAGLLIIFGGESEDHRVPSKQLMNNITIYEHEGKTWHYQIATGSVIPKYRQYMCTVGVREDGQQSYEIFMYGGFSGDFGPGQIDYDDIWILSIPAFQWFKAHGVSSGSRFGHTCHDVGGRYMMTIGGITALVHAKERWNGPDTTDYSIALFDMTNLTWTDTFSPQSPSYERPSVVRSWYEANGQYPERWDQPALKDLIVNNISFASDTTSGEEGTATSRSPATSGEEETATSRSLQSAPSTRSPVPVIGGVLGGIASVALLILYFVFLRRLLRKRLRAFHQNCKKDGKNESENCVPGPYELEQKSYLHELEQKANLARLEQSANLAELPGSHPRENGTDSSQVGEEAAAEVVADAAVRSS